MAACEARNRDLQTFGRFHLGLVSARKKKKNVGETTNIMIVRRARYFKGFVWN